MYDDICVETEPMYTSQIIKTLLIYLLTFFTIKVMVDLKVGHKWGGLFLSWSQRG